MTASYRSTEKMSVTFDADARRQRAGDCGQARPGRRDFDHQVGPVHHPPEQFRFRGRSPGVLGETGIDLDRHPPVEAVGRVVDGPQQVTDGADVVGGQQPDRLGDGDVQRGEVRDLLVVDVTAGDRLVEDGRIGGHADHVLVADECLQVARHQPLTAHVVEPDRHAFIRHQLQRISDEVGPFHLD